jgi:DNA-binding CsgD family transcriptional regulator
VLVQREEQIAGLRQAYLACREQGRGQVVLVRGPVGSGKTQLLEVFGEWVTGRGGRMLRAAGSWTEREMPLGVIGQLMQGAPLDPETAGRVDGFLEDAFLRISRAPGTLEDLPTSDAFWVGLLHGVFTALENLGNEGTLAVAVDDLHHTDAASLQCLLYVIRRLRRSPVMFVLTESSMLRPPHPLLLAELFSQPSFRRHTLPLLTADAVARLVEGDTHGPAGPPVRETADRLLGVTGGNPLLTRALIDARSGGPDAFDQAVLRCLHRHEPCVWQVARALAVLDRGASEELIGRLLDVPAEFTAPALRLLSGAGLTDSGRLRHPRILNAIVSDIPAEERWRLHRRAAEVLHEHGAEAGDIARHLVATAWTDAPWVLTVLREAAEEALSAGRPDTAAACLQLLTRAAVTPGQRVAATAMLVGARWQVNPLSVTGQLDKLTDDAAACGRPGGAALSAVPYLLWHGRAEEAVEAVGGTSDDVRALRAGWSRTMRQMVALFHPEKADAVRDAPEASGRGTAESGPLRPAQQAVAVLDAALTPERGNDAVPAAERLLQRHHEDDGALGLLTGPLLTLLWSGAAARAARWGDALLARPTARHAPTLRGILRAIRAEAALRLGDLEGAERHARTALEDLPEQAWGVAVGGPLGTLANCATEAGRFADADRWLSRPVPPGTFRTPLGVHYLAARGRHHHAAGRIAAAVADLRRCGELMTTWDMDVAGLVPWRLELAKVQFELGNRTQAAQLLRDQLNRAHGVDDRTRGRALRLLAHTVSAEDRRGLLAKAVGLLQSCGDRLELVRALNDTSRALQHAGDSARARLFVQRAHQVARDPGPQVVEGGRVTRQRYAGRTRPEPDAEVLGGTEVPRGPESADGADSGLLSEAERRVALLAAQGHTNRQISDRLYITVSTVEQHLTRVYRKLDVKRRTDLPERLVACRYRLDEDGAHGTEAC